LPYRLLDVKKVVSRTERKDSGSRSHFSSTIRFRI
jgi:hypothetical protein